MSKETHSIPSMVYVDLFNEVIDLYITSNNFKLETMINIKTLMIQLFPLIQ